MKYKGRFINGEFRPDTAMSNSYRAFKSKCEQESIRVSIEITKATRDVSESQVGLFWIIVKMIEESTGSNTDQILIYFNKYRPKKDNQPIMFHDMSTIEMSEFIERGMIGANEDFNLNIKASLLPNGETKITNYEK